jgi:DNA repair exonuclease SbcCD ATPase subunit
MSIEKTLLQMADEIEKMASAEYEVKRLHKMAHMISAINGLSILKDLSTLNKTAAIDFNPKEPEHGFFVNPELKSRASKRTKSNPTILDRIKSWFAPEEPPKRRQTKQTKQTEQTEQIGQYKKRIANLKRQIQNLQRENQVTLNEYQQRLIEHKNLIDKLQDQIQKGEISRAEAQQQIEGSRNEIARLNALLKEQGQQLSNIEKQLAGKAELVEKMRGELGSKEKTIQDLTKKLSRYKWFGPAGLALGFGGKYLYDKLTEDRKRGLLGL